VWSPDGGSIVYSYASLRPPDLFVKRVGSAAAPERLFEAPYQSFPQSWSPDGQYVVYVTIEPKTGQNIWRVPVREPRTPTPLVRTQYFESHPRISPDGRWLAYSSSEAGRFEIYIARLPDADGKRLISTEGGQFPIWRRDGRELYYLTRDGSVMAVQTQSDGGAGLSVGTPVRLFTAPRVASGPGAGTPYDVAPDGRFLINVFLRRTAPPATVLLNWRADVESSSR
jgi:Tol biopolymer transport system component